jgi:GTP cyclohydrolase IA
MEGNTVTLAGYSLKYVDKVSEYCQNRHTYCIPKNGWILGMSTSGLLMVDDIHHAEVIFDDILDSGQTIRSLVDQYSKEIDFKQVTLVVVFSKYDFRRDPKGLEKEFKDILFVEAIPKDTWIDFWFEGGHEHDSTKTVTRVIEQIGEDPNREGLLDTPKRVVKSWKEIFAGYNTKVEDLLTTFDSDGYDQIVLLKNIELYSMCEHHMLPFVGKAHVAYLPKKKIIGISKLARLVDMFARRLQIQERIGEEVTQALMEHLDPLGAACIIEADHYCMRMRGVNKQMSNMVTSSVRGVFREDSGAKSELMALING